MCVVYKLTNVFVVFMPYYMKVLNTCILLDKYSYAFPFEFCVTRSVNAGVKINIVND